MCSLVRFHSARVKDLRYLDMSSHEIAVVTGAAVSPARFRVMKPGAQWGCPYCGMLDASWEHVSLLCTRSPRRAGLTKSSCKDVLQQRLRWPSGTRCRKRINAEILAWLAKVRADCLAVRKAESMMCSLISAADKYEVQPLNFFSTACSL